MQRTYDDIRQAIRERMEEFGMSQNALAAETAKHGTPTSAPMIRLFINHRKQIGTDRLEAMLKALKLKLHITTETHEASQDDIAQASSGRRR